MKRALIWNILLILFFLFLMTGCDGVPVETEHPLSEEETSTANEYLLETEEALAEATTEPPAKTDLLPAPVIYLSTASDEPVAPGHNDMWRLEVDGTTMTKITDEQASITGFDVSPIDGSIVYITFGDFDLYRIDASGSEHALLVDGPELEDRPGDKPFSSLSNPVISPDGSQIAYALGGVNILPTMGGESRQILTNVPGPEGSLEWISSFYPVSWSPDGTRILVGDSVGGGFSIVNVVDNSVIKVNNPIGDFFCCGPTWSVDGQSIYFSGVLYDPGIFQAPGLWRIDADTGETVTLIPGYEDTLSAQESGASMALIQSAQQLSDGNLYAFAVFGTYKELWLDDTGNIVFPRLEMTRFQSDGSQPVTLRSYTDQFGEAPWIFGDALWAHDASGAVTIILGADSLPNSTLLWLPSDGSEAVVLGGRGFHYRWGR
jgi:hypothetical protein